MHKINSKILCIWLLKTNLKIICNHPWIKDEIRKKVKMLKTKMKWQNTIALLEWVFFQCFLSVQFSSVQSLSRVRLFATPWITALQASLSITNSRSSLRLTSIESVMPSSHLILCHPLSSPSPPAPNPSQHQSLFQWVNSPHEVKVIKPKSYCLDNWRCMCGYIYIYIFFFYYVTFLWWQIRVPRGWP